MRGIRYLHLDSIWVQGAMRIKQPYQLELDYIRRMMAALLLQPTESVGEGHAVQLGLGAAALTKFTAKVMKMKTTAVELNPSVIDACRMWFALPDDDQRLQVVQGDADAWVHEPAHWGTVQLLQVDLYDHTAAGPVLDTEDFYRHCYRLLDDGGVMSVNLFGNDARFERSLARMKKAFAGDPVSYLEPCKEGNTIAIAGKALPWPDRDTLHRRAVALHDIYQLPAQKWVKLIHDPSS